MRAIASAQSPWRSHTCILPARLAAKQQWRSPHELATLQRSRARRSQDLRRARSHHRAAHPRPRRRLCGAARAAAWQAADGRALHLLRSFRPGAVRVRQGHGRAAASAYRACHRHLSVRRQHHASRQRGQHSGDHAGRDEPDDRGTRHRPFRAHAGSAAPRRPEDAGPAELDRAAGRQGRNRAVVPALRRGRSADDHRARLHRARHRGQLVRHQLAGRDGVAMVLHRGDGGGRRQRAARSRSRGARDLSGRRRGRDRERAL